MVSFERFAARFWHKVDKSGGPTACWPWLSYFFKATGYGQFWVSGRLKEGAHRLAWELTYGDIPKGISVCHKCDNRACCNPKHLFLGTPADNSADAKAKGRSLKGMKQIQAKLTDDVVRDIRQSTLTQKQLGKKHGVTQSTIWRAIHTNWQHVQ